MICVWMTRFWAKMMSTSFLRLTAWTIFDKRLFRWLKDDTYKVWDWGSMALWILCKFSNFLLIFFFVVLSMQFWLWGQPLCIFIIERNKRGTVFCWTSSGHINYSSLATKKPKESSLSFVCSLVGTLTILISAAQIMFLVIMTVS